MLFDPFRHDDNIQSNPIQSIRETCMYVREIALWTVSYMPRRPTIRFCFALCIFYFFIERGINFSVLRIARRRVGRGYITYMKAEAAAAVHRRRRRGYRYLICVYFILERFV